MNINKTQEDKKVTLAVEGRLDTTTAPDLEAAIEACIEGLEELDFDFAELEYISSAGLRVILGAQKKMNKQGKMVIRNANDVIMEVFEITGFVDILTIE
ncbi:MAG: STAS domain-containing protein [Clostridia bacterium]|nr:STAS domain-containing protein [Clostridia bacterium]